MNAQTTSRFLGLVATLGVAALLAPAAALAAREAPPQVSPEGLQLVKSTRTRVVYVKPGATFAQYHRIAILQPLVEFEKNWQKDYNASKVGLQGRVTDDDVERMKTRLADEFMKVFTKEMQEKGGYPVVNESAPDVLVLRPALLNVEVNAPDIMTAGIEHTVVRSAGQMTLYLELWDAATNTLLARVMDAQEDRDSMPQLSSSVTNRAAADRILGQWARELRERLDEVKSKPGA